MDFERVGLEQHHHTSATCKLLGDVWQVSNVASGSRLVHVRVSCETRSSFIRGLLRLTQGVFYLRTGVTGRSNIRSVYAIYGGLRVT